MKPFLRSRHAGVFLSLLLFGVLIIFMYVLNKSVDDMSGAMGCTNKVIQKLDSQEEKYSVFKFERLCGATAPDTLQMSVQPFGLPFDNEKYPSFLVLDRRADALGGWHGPKHFSVQFDSVAKIYHKEPRSIDVDIQYTR